MKKSFLKGLCVVLVAGVNWCGGTNVVGASGAFPPAKKESNIHLMSILGNFKHEEFHLTINKFFEVVEALKNGFFEEKDFFENFELKLREMFGGTFGAIINLLSYYEIDDSCYYECTCYMDHIRMIKYKSPTKEPIIIFPLEKIDEGLSAEGLAPKKCVVPSLVIDQGTGTFFIRFTDITTFEGIGEGEQLYFRSHDFVIDPLSKAVVESFVYDSVTFITNN